MEQIQTELEAVLKKTIEKQSRRIAALTLDLDLAHSQLELLADKNNAESEGTSDGAGSN